MIGVFVGAYLLYKVPKSLHIDEALQYQYTSMSLKGAVEGSYVQSVPPLNNLIQYIFGLVINPTNFTLRIPSILFSVLFSITLQKILARYIGEFHAVCIVFFIFLSPIVLTFSRYSRSYALTLFLIILVLFLILNLKNFTSASIILCLLPWSRTVEGATATVIFLMLMLVIQRKPIASFRIFILTILILTSLTISLTLSMRTGNNYKSELDFKLILGNLFERICMVLELADNHLSIVDFIAAFLIPVYLVTFAKRKHWDKFFAYTAYSIFAISSPVLILSTSTIPLFPRYIYFYAVVYMLNLYLAGYFIIQKISLRYSYLLIIVLSLPVLHFQEISRSPFPPFYEAAKYINENPQRNVYAFLPGEVDQFMAAWPVQPNFRQGTIWISTLVKDGGKLPDAILIFPRVDPSYETIKKDLKFDLAQIKTRNLGGGLILINLDSDIQLKLKELSRVDFGGAEIWFSLLGLRVAEFQGDFESGEDFLEDVCPYSDKLISPGTLFGDFASPPLSINDFLLKTGLPNCAIK